MILKNNKNFSQLLMILIITIGVIISGLGIYFVSRQKNALELNLQNQSTTRLKEILNRMEKNLAKEVQDLFIRHPLPVSDPLDAEDMEKYATSILDQNSQLVRLPFAISPSGKLIYPESRGPILDLTEKVDARFFESPGINSIPAESEPTITNLALSMIKSEGLRQLFIEGIIHEFKHKNYREAQKLYKRCSLRTKNNRIKPFFLNGIARCYSKQGQVKESIRLYQIIRNQYLSILVKDSEILLYRVFRQLALSFNLINDKGTAWIKYFSLYKRIFETRDPDDHLLVLFKNEALDFILRHNPPDFPVFLSDNFQKLHQQVKKQPQTMLDKRLKKAYAGLKGMQWHGQMFEIPREVENIIDSYRQELILCRALEAYPGWEKLNPSKGEVQRIKGETGDKSFPVAFSKGKNGYTFGFLINPEFFKGQVFLSTDKQLAEDADTKLFVKGGPPDPEFKHPLQTLSMAPLFPEETLILAAKKKGYYQDRVRRDVWISYGLIALLILTFILGIFLLYKYLSREAELVRLKSNFVDGVSHTLKTPLTRLSLLAEAVQEGCVQDENKRERFFNIVISETIRMNEIINNILNFSRVESGKKIYQPESLLLQQVVQHILKQGASSLQNLGFVLEKEIDTEIPPVHLDREAAKLIVLNLLQNAIKYSVDEKFIRVRLFMDGLNVRLIVEDRGLGIGRKNLARIFEKFYRETDKRIQALEGSGLGLFLVHHAVKAHGGDIQVSSQKGEGSVFRVSFPVKGNPDG